MTTLPPTIGISSQLFPDHAGALTFGVQESYINYLLPLGARPLIIPVIELIDHAADFCALCDGFLIPGGNDIGSSKDHIVRDRANTALIHAALDYHIPLLGICYGSQILNVALGGTLHTSLPTSPINHNPGTPGNNHHLIQITPDTPLASSLSTPAISSLTKPTLTFPVNSFHHQGVNQLAPALKPMATAPDHLIEAFYHPAAPFCWGIQWHPERMASASLSQTIASAFLDACRQTH